MHATPADADSGLNGRTTPRPKWPLWRTRFRWPRPVRRFVPAIVPGDCLERRPDPGEAAHHGGVVLLHDEMAVLHRDGTITKRMHVLNLLHGDQELAAWDQVSRQFDTRYSRHDIHAANIYLPEGPVIRAKPSVQRYYGTWKHLNITFTHLRPGVVIEFDEQVDWFVVDDAAPAMWLDACVQGNLPVRWFRFTAAVAEPFSLGHRTHHIDAVPREWTQEGYRLYQWEFRDLPGIEYDAWNPAARDFVPWIDVSTLRSWEPVVRWHAKEIAPTAAAIQQARPLARQLEARASDTLAKVKAVHTYLSRDVRYGRHVQDHYQPRSREAEKILQDLRGDCKDKSSLMVALLREYGVEASVAILLTRQLGITPYLPGARRFDHAIVLATVDGRPMWFDPAAGPYCFGELPHYDLGVSALLLDENEVRLVEIEEPPPDARWFRRECTGCNR